MLNPRPITDAIVAALCDIETLATWMTVTDSNEQASVRITAHHYDLGADHKLAEAVYKMPAPSILVAWDGSGPGQADGQTLFKHRFSIYIRAGNVAGSNDPVSYEDIWWQICNGVPEGSTVNIRYMTVYPGLEVMDTPGVVHMVDEELYDRFKGLLIFPEIGDN